MTTNPIHHRWCALAGIDPASTAPVLDVPHVSRVDMWSALTTLDPPLTRGVEVGTQRGHYARALCTALPSLHLTCVDAYQYYPAYPVSYTGPPLYDAASQAQQEALYRTAQRRLAPYRCDIRRAWSVDAARDIPDGSLDLVYIDANHQEAYVWADLHAWASKVRPGGVIAGHDYINSQRGNTRVKAAVTRWRRLHPTLQLWVFDRDSGAPTWAYLQGPA